MMTVALETQHGVDEMLEHSRTGEVTFFGDVPDEHKGNRATLCEVDEKLGAGSYLCYRPGR